VPEPSIRELEASTKEDSLIANTELASNISRAESWTSTESTKDNQLAIEDARSIGYLSDSNNSQCWPAIEEDALSAPSSESSPEEPNDTELAEEASIAIRVLESAWQEQCNCGKLDNEIVGRQR